MCLSTMGFICMGLGSLTGSGGFGAAGCSFRRNLEKYLTGNLRHIDVERITHMAKYVTGYGMKGLKRPMFSPDHILVLPKTLGELPDQKPWLGPPNSSSEHFLRPFSTVVWTVPRLTIGSLNMQILVSILYRRTGESWKSIQCEAANRGNMPCLVAIPSEKALALFPQKLVTSGGNEIQEKNELYRRRSGQQSECRLFRIRCRMAPITPITR